MAFVTKQVYITDNALAIAPTGHTANTAAASIGTVDIKSQSLSFDITASSSATTTKAATFDDLIKTELVTAVDNHIQNVMYVNVVAQSVNYNCRVTNVTRGDEENDIFLNDATAVYSVSVILDVAVS